MQKGKAAIQEYCKQRKFTDFVIEGGLEYLISKWEKMVLRVKNGCTMTKDEYLNDMGTRRIINEVWLPASDDQIAQYQEQLKDADEEYFDSTVSCEECIWGSKNAAKYGYIQEVDWWYYHFPINKGFRW